VRASRPIGGGAGDGCHVAAFLARPVFCPSGSDVAPDIPDLLDAGLAIVTTVAPATVRCKSATSSNSFTTDSFSSAGERPSMFSGSGMPGKNLTRAPFGILSSYRGHNFCPCSAGPRVCGVLSKDGPSFFCVRRLAPCPTGQSEHSILVERTVAGWTMTQVLSAPAAAAGTP
jgi:hypothetical protein